VRSPNGFDLTFQRKKNETYGEGRQAREKKKKKGKKARLSRIIREGRGTKEIMLWEKNCPWSTGGRSGLEKRGSGKRRRGNPDGKAP